MNRALAGLWMAVMFASAAVLLATGTRAATARLRSQNADRDLRAIGDQAGELALLRSSRTDFPERPTSGEGGLASKVSAAMARAGLPASILQSLSPEAQSAAQGEARVSRRRATLTLAGLSLSQVGKFLDAWRTAEPAWIISGIDLAPMISKEAPSIGTDLPLRAVITIEGVFKERL